MKGWINLKDGHPPVKALVELRTNSKDRHPREAYWDEGFRKFYEEDENGEMKIASGEEWRLLEGKTPVTEEPCVIIYENDDLPDHFKKDRVNCNEYYTTYYDKNGTKYSYSHQDDEIKSVWT